MFVLLLGLADQNPDWFALMPGAEHRQWSLALGDLLSTCFGTTKERIGCCLVELSAQAMGERVEVFEPKDDIDRSFFGDLDTHAEGFTIGDGRWELDARKGIEPFAGGVPAILGVSDHADVSHFWVGHFFSVDILSFVQWPNRYPIRNPIRTRSA